MGLLEQLQDQGWYLLPAGLDRLLEGTTGTIEVKQAIKLALDIDLREIGGGALGSITTRGNKVDTIEGNIVVQILKIRNISAPKANEESKVAPRLLKLTLTDGQTQYSALEGEHVPAISLDTPPGTKIFLKNGPIKISQGLFILNANNVSVLGGKVPALVEKWELGRAMAKYAKGGRIQLSASGPPPWIAFGQKIQQNLPNDKNFKSLQTKEKDESKENAEFTALRNDAIAEATKLGTKKTFGGGAKQMVDANVQKIMDKGFSEDQATHALKLTRNNVHRALSNLQRIEERKQTQSDIKTGKIEPPPKLGKRGTSGKRDLESETTSKPSAKVSLFDFLEDILPESDTTNKKNTSKESTPFSAKENKSSADSYSSKQMSNTAYLGSSTNNRSSSNLQNQFQANTSSHYNNANKSYNQQRFENNISSSFANRNSHSSGNRNYNQQPQQPHQPGMNSSSGYKQSTDYNSGRYNSHSNDAHPRSRQDSKYNQSHSSYNPHQHQQQSQYRNDNYNNNPSSGGQPSKYNSNLSSNGKSQQSNVGYNYGHVDGRSSQCYNGQSDSRKHPNAQPAHYQQQQQQSQPTQQQLPYQGSKPVQGYNANNNASGHPNSHHNSSTNHYGQQNANSMNNNGNYTSGNPAINVKVQKTRYGKEEPQKYPGPPINAAPTQGRKAPPKVHNSSQPQATSTTPGNVTQPPFVPGSKQVGTTPPGSNKMVQLSEATANLQIGSKSYNNNPQALNSAKAPQGPMGGPAGPPPPSSNTAAVVPKNYIQLPNGFNYNPYQIMGFQNKQTNEFALNVLKSQQFDALQSAHLAAAQPGGPPVPTVSGPIPGVTMPPSATVVPSVLTAATTGPSPATVHPTAVLPSWKVGDRCLAKYWEDGGFYNAEITGISESTFVVCFLEYGNYEEVLKTDCIPLSQPTGPATAPPHGPPPPAGMSFHPQAGTHLPPVAPLMPPPSGAYPGQGADSQSGQHYSHGYKPQPSQYPHHPPPHHQSQQQRPSKFREQRPMYVPPAQRK